MSIMGFKNGKGKPPGIVDGLRVTGSIQIKKNGKLVQEIKNLVVTTGKTWVAARLKNDSGTTAIMDQMKIGSGTTAPVVGNTDIETELAAVVFDSVTPSSNTIVYVTTFPAGTGTGTVSEAALFESVGSILFTRTLLSTPVVKAAGDAIEITWTITVS